MTGSRAVFSGLDASSNSNLWVTNGTSAGTSELAVSGANSGGLFNLHYFSAGFTVLGGKVLFVGQDTSGNANLWVTDGAETGTSELAAANANVYRRMTAATPLWHSNGTAGTGGGRRLVKKEGLPWV
jgi:ELWxxDGT repeat protein